MGKSYHRKEHISARRAREEELKKKNQKKLTKKQKGYIWAGAAAAAVVILLIVAFYAPNGSVITWFGNPMFLKENAILASADDRYYDLGAWTAPDGYTRDEEYTIKRDKKLFEGYYNRDSEEGLPASFYVTSVSEKPEVLREKLASYTPTASKVMHYDGEKFDFDYFYYTNENEQDKSLQQLSIACYIPVNDQFSIHLALFSGYEKAEMLPSVEDLLKSSQAVLSGLEIK